MKASYAGAAVRLRICSAATLNSSESAILNLYDFNIITFLSASTLLS